MPPATTRKLSTADDRREAVLEAALPVFAARGIHGTPTLDVATAAGISQAYLFRLFPTKEELAVALVRRCHERVAGTFAAAAAEARRTGGDVLEHMGRAYIGLLRDRDLLLLQLHAHAAAPDVPAIRDATRDGFARLVAEVERASGAPAAELRRFFAFGMLLNVMAALDAEHADGHWRDVLVGDALGPVDDACC